MRLVNTERRDDGSTGLSWEDSNEYCSAQCVYYGEIGRLSLALSSQMKAEITRWDSQDANDRMIF